jgi:type VI secretion system protein ImpM
MSQTSPVSMVYFGKLPSRGDFVRSANQAALTQTLDRWLTQGVEMMAEDPRWKETYDQAAPVHFAFLGVKSRAVLAGHLIASTDASGRRFPFIAASTFELGGPANHAGAPLAFMSRSPMVLARLWTRFEQAARQAVTAADAGSVLNDLNQTLVEVETTPQAYDASFSDFLELQTIGGVETMLRQAGHTVSLRRSLLALGLLLRPVPASGQNALEKGLSLPLPTDPLYQPFVATLWIDLVARFLTRGDFEVVLFLPQANSAHAPRLQIGFSGGSPAILQAALDQQVGTQVFVDLNAADWVEDQTQSDYGVKKLSSYLEQPQLSLQRALATFSEAFLGD